METKEKQKNTAPTRKKPCQYSLSAGLKVNDQKTVRGQCDSLMLLQTMVNKCYKRPPLEYILSKFQVSLDCHFHQTLDCQSSVLTNTSSGNGANCVEMLFKPLKKEIWSAE